MPETVELNTVKNDNGEFTYVKLPARPEGVPEKFWHPEQGLNLTALNNGYVSLESGRSRFQEETRNNLKTEFEAKLPKPPEQYQVTAPELDSPPPGFSFDPASDPVITTAISVGKEAGLTQEGLNTIVKARAEAALNGFKEIGERTVKVLGENAADRIGKVTRRLEELLGPDEAKAIASISTDPASVIALEKLIGGGGSPGSGTGGGGEPPVTEATLKEWMRDPRYHNPQMRDPAWCKKIEDGFKQLYGDQKHDRAPHYSGAA